MFDVNPDKISDLTTFRYHNSPILKINLLKLKMEKQVYLAEARYNVIDGSNHQKGKFLFHLLLNIKIKLLSK